MEHPQDMVLQDMVELHHHHSMVLQATVPQVMVLLLKVVPLLSTLIMMTTMGLHASFVELAPIIHVEEKWDVLL